MKSCITLAAVALSCLLMYGCSSELEESVEISSVEVDRVIVKMEDSSFTNIDANSRAMLVDESEAHGGTPWIGYVWTEGDVLGIFPNEGSQVDFPIASEDIGKSDATFDGGGWALKKGYRYAAYYPYNYDYNDKTSIPLDYTGQKQTGNGNMDHLNDYRYQSTKQAVTATSSELEFDISFTGALLWFRLKMPESGTFTKLNLRSDNLPFIKKGKLDLSGETRTIIPEEESEIVSIDLDDIWTTSEDELISIYMWIIPRDFSDSNISVEIETEDGNIYTTNFASVKLDSKFYYIDRGGEGKPAISLSYDVRTEFISFEDSKVKDICVANWDLDGDGELSYAEAAAVQSLDKKFYHNKEITSFEELQYFTGLLEIEGDAFNSCQKLQRINLPKNITTIGDKVFYQCYELAGTIIIPEGVLSIGTSAFYKCTALERVVMASTTTTWGDNIFNDCSNLIEVNLPEGMLEVPGGAFSDCKSLQKIVIPASVEKVGGLSGCLQISYIRFLGQTPPSLRGNTVFNRTYCSIYVPAESLADYIAKWKDFNLQENALSRVHAWVD